VTVHKFNGDDLAMLWELAHRFQDVKLAYGIADKRVARTYSGIEIHYINLKAIHAAAARLGVNYDRRVRVAGRKKPPLHLSEPDGRGVRVYARQNDLILDKVFDAPLAILAVPWASVVHKDPYVTSPAMLKAGWYARDMSLAYCTRQQFQDFAQRVDIPKRGRKLRLNWNRMTPLLLGNAGGLIPAQVADQGELFSAQDWERETHGAWYDTED
jgi:hypothetical protein